MKSSLLKANPEFPMVIHFARFPGDSVDKADAFSGIFQTLMSEAWFELVSTSSGRLLSED